MFWKPNDQEEAYVRLIMSMCIDSLRGKGTANKGTFACNLRRMADSFETEKPVAVEHNFDLVTLVPGEGLRPDSQKVEEPVKACNTCKFWFRKETTETVRTEKECRGSCCRYPPNINGGDLDVDCFPMTKALWFCGEWVEGDWEGYDENADED